MTNTSQSPLWDLFLCHNGADKDWVRALGEQVESETFDGNPSGRALRVFFDEWDIDIGANMVLRINEGLTKSRYVAVVVSPEMLQAPWPTMEWTHLVADDPTNRKGRLIPLFLRDYSAKLELSTDLPVPLKALNWIDFRNPKLFSRGFRRLIRKIRDQPPERGKRRRPMATAATPVSAADPDNSAAPDRLSEVILGNLLPVEVYPLTVWSAPTAARTNKEVYESIPNHGAFELQEGRLFCFSDLTVVDEPLRAAVDPSEIKSHRVADWRTDDVRWKWFISLLHKALRAKLRKLPMRQDDRRRYFFLPNRDGTGRNWKNGKDPAREVAACKPASKDESFWVHHGADLRFQTLGDQLYLRVEPCYVFTSDGIHPLRGTTVASLSMKWGGKERNAAILRHIVFWARTLSKGEAKISVATGASPIFISGVPALARISFGIEFDHIGFGSLISQVDDELEQVARAMTKAADVSSEEDED
jgi:hypothetical protein